ncbi:unnamed protein product, partial [Notodromas monacha]
MAALDMTLEIELGVTGGEEDGVDNTDVDNSKLYTQPEEVWQAYQALSLVSSRFTIAAAFGNVHGVYKPGGSMGSVMGEKISRAVDYCLEHKLPYVIICKSGGARMMEAAISLMQLAKIQSKLSRLAQHKLPYIPVLTDPTFGGVTASFAMVGDVIMAEPGALIGFAGPR